jgi:hypothetical protein
MILVEIFLSDGKGRNDTITKMKQHLNYKYFKQTIFT